MPDTLSKELRHKTMAAIHSSSTKSELKLRHALWQHGFRYRINYKLLPGTPDIVLSKYHTVIFIHGCFWHGHNGCKYHTIPQTNTAFWTAKITRNQERDQDVWRQLEAKGWFVIVVWECQLKKSSFQGTFDKVKEEILCNGDKFRFAQDERRKNREVYHQAQKQREEREAVLQGELEAKFH